MTRNTYLNEYDIERFIRFVDKTTSTNGCWLWKGCLSNKGYGHFSINGKAVLAHRVYYEYVKGDLGDLFCCHHCDNPACVNPDHMFAGTMSENIQDCVDKGRHNNAKGSKHGRSKLLEHEVFAIKQLIKEGKSQRQIAKIYGVSKSSIALIKKGQNWSHI